MRDHHRRSAAVFLQRSQQVDDLGLNRHVQRRRRLVGEQQPRAACQSDGDHHALALAAGKLVRVRVKTTRRRGNAHQFQQPERLFAGGGARSGTMRGDLLGDLSADAQRRIQRRQRVLKYDRAVFAAIAFPLARRLRENIPSRKEDVAAAFDLARRRDQPHHAPRRDRLAAARFTDERHRLAFVDEKRRAAHGLKLAGVGAKGNAQIANFQKMSHVAAYFCRRGSSACWSASPSTFRQSTVTRMKVPGTSASSGL